MKKKTFRISVALFLALMLVLTSQLPAFAAEESGSATSGSSASGSAIPSSSTPASSAPDSSASGSEPQQVASSSQNEPEDSGSEADSSVAEPPAENTKAVARAPENTPLITVEGNNILVQHPGDGEDASPAIQAAVEAAKQISGGVVISFENDKQYDVFPETAYFQTGYYISNSQTADENPNGDRWSAILLQDMKDVTVEGNNAMLMIHGVMTPLFVDRSENITFQNLHVDWARPTMSEFTITEVGETYVKVKVNQDSRYQLEGANNQTIRWLSEDKPGGGYYWTLTGGLVVRYDATRDLAYRDGFTYPSAITDEGNNVLRMEYGSRQNLVVGDTYQFRSGSREQVGSFIHRSKNVHFENMGFHYMHGLGIVGQFTENLSFNKLDCTPRPETGRTAASSADFMQISGCRGQVSVTNSNFRGAHDDVFNIHGTHHRIVQADAASRTIVVRFMETRSWGFQAYQEGDEIEFVNSNEMLSYGSNRVKSWRKLDNYQIELVLESPLPDNIRLNADVIENVTWTPDVYLAGNKAWAIATRGILCTTRGNVVIENNEFYRTQMSAILLEDDGRGWYESGPVRNMVIRNNLFDNCAGPQFFSNPQTNVLDPEKTVHSNIQLIGNTYKGYAEIRAISTSDLVVQGNVFEDGGVVNLSACNGFTVADDNVGLGSVGATKSLKDRSLAAFSLDGTETVDTLPRTGMTATTNNQRDGYEASKVLDGDNNTIWHTDWEAPPADNPEITIDFGEEKTFNRVAVLPRQNGESTGMITGYKLYLEQGGRWKEAASGSWPANALEKAIEFEEPVTATGAKLEATGVVQDTSDRVVASVAEINFRNVVCSGEPVPMGRNFKPTATILGVSGMPADLKDATFTYESLAPHVATVNDEGVVTAVATGQTTLKVSVTAFGKTLQDSLTIVVSDETYHAAKEITVEEPEDSQMQVSVVPANAGGDVRWSVEAITGEATITEEGVLKPTKEGRVLVKAYSDNDASVAGTAVVLLKRHGELCDTWSWVRENQDNWSLGANNSFKLTLEPGAIWSATTNYEKNVLCHTALNGDVTLITRMHGKPSANYAEAGIALYQDDDNYVLLTRKKHSGYGGNIFSVITEIGGNPAESPASQLVPDNVASETIYFKLERKGNLFSGYYSENGSTWVPVWENRDLALGDVSPAIMGYGASGQAEYDYLDINGSKYTFEGLGFDTNLAKVTKLDTVEKTVPIGTTFGALGLPAQITAIWNGSYPESYGVVWDADGYRPQFEGKQTITGTLEGAYLPEDIEVQAVIQRSSIPVTGVGLSAQTLTLKVGQTSQLTAQVSPAGATNPAVRWASDTPAIATVNANGTVTGVKAGTATVTVTTADGGRTASCVVTVTAAPAEAGGTTLPASSKPAKAGQTPHSATSRSVSESAASLDPASSFGSLSASASSEAASTSQAVSAPPVSEPTPPASGGSNWLLWVILAVVAGGAVIVVVVIRRLKNKER